MQPHTPCRVSNRKTFFFRIALKNICSSLNSSIRHMKLFYDFFSSLSVFGYEASSHNNFDCSSRSKALRAIRSFLFDFVFDVVFFLSSFPIHHWPDQTAAHAAHILAIFYILHFFSLHLQQPSASTLESCEYNERDSMNGGAVLEK